MKAKIVVAIPAAFVLLCLVLLLSGKRLLVWETKVEPGETYIIPDWGNVGEGKENAALVD